MLVFNLMLVIFKRAKSYTNKTAITFINYDFFLCVRQIFILLIK